MGCDTVRVLSTTAWPTTTWAGPSWSRGRWQQCTTHTRHTIHVRTMPHQPRGAGRSRRHRKTGQRQERTEGPWRDGGETTRHARDSVCLCPCLCGGCTYRILNAPMDWSRPLGSPFHVRCGPRVYSLSYRRNYEGYETTRRSGSLHRAHTCTTTSGTSPVPKVRKGGLAFGIIEKKGGPWPVQWYVVINVEAVLYPCWSMQYTTHGRGEDLDTAGRFEAVQRVMWKRIIH